MIEASSFSPRSSPNWMNGFRQLGNAAIVGHDEIVRATSAQNHVILNRAGSTELPLSSQRLGVRVQALFSAQCPGAEQLTLNLIAQGRTDAHQVALACKHSNLAIGRIAP